MTSYYSRNPYDPPSRSFDAHYERLYDKYAEANDLDPTHQLRFLDLSKDVQDDMLYRAWGDGE